ncbi:DUF459 domain-containing protein [Acinetobacter sp. B5B]|uniref:SGNH/GDSL hydrolase family protein n=1 Tax=Acinetobacter baretiae TaxID=2605383 RepID=UPI0018C1E222|nr:DUF459 domain-containing protein [Acinetobacter baretiae]MBF7681921.1 DUF459 domain-containing protein [Acinetobacter baretiae]
MQISKPTLPNVPHSNFACSSTDQTHYMGVLYTLIVLITGAITGLWLLQNSVNAYYEQTYHAESPLHVLDQYRLWQQGAQWGSILYQKRDVMAQNIAQNNQIITDVFNQKYAYSVEYTQRLQQKIAVEKQHQQHLLAVQEQQKAQDDLSQKFTLTANDQVFFAGDSMMQGVAPHVQKALLEQFKIKTVNLSKQSTGLAYPKFFDWPKTIKDTLVSHPNIKVLVVFLGPNDPWDMPNPHGGSYLKYESPEWEQLYRSRVADIIQTANQHHVSVMWITPPNMRKPVLNKQMMYLNHVVADEVQKNNALSIDSREILGNINNIYSDYFYENGQAVKARSADGIHFSPDGQKRIANTILHYLKVS